MIKLYSYWRSSAAYRVRIALHLKGLAFETVPVNLIENEQYESEYDAINPQHGVPSLVDHGVVLTQSQAIIEYLEEKYPNLSLLPEDQVSRAKHRAIAQAIACDIHPLNNLRVLRHLKKMGHTQSEIDTWYTHWLEEGLRPLERMVSETGLFSLGPQPGMADCFIVPQLYNARRYKFPLETCPNLLRIEAAAKAHPAFIAAAPENQPDAVAL